VAGSLAAGFLFIPLLGVQTSILLAAAIYLLVGSMITLTSPSNSKLYRNAVIATALVFLGVGAILPSWNKSFSQSGIYTKGQVYLHKTSRDLQFDLERPELLFYKEGIASLVAVQNTGNQLVLKINGKVQSGTKTDLEPQLLLGHLPMLFHPDPKQALVIGFGTGMTVGAFEQYGELEKVTVVELEPEVIEAGQYFANDNNHALKNPRLELAIGDGRNYLLSTHRSFDIISSHPSNVWIKGMVNLLTKEYFELAKSRLGPDGIMAQWIPTDAVDNHVLGSILATFQNVFPHTTLWASTDSSEVIFLGSPTPLVVDLDLFKARMTQPRVRRDLRRIGVINPEALFSFFVLDRKAVSKMSQGAPLQTDNYPILEFSAPEALYSAINNIKKNEEILREHYASPLSLFDGAVLGEDTRRAIAQYGEFRKKVLQATFYGQFEGSTFTLLREAFDLFPHNEVVQRTLIGVYDARINYLQTKRGREKELSQAYQDKIKVYRDILALDDNNSTLHRDLGWAYRMLGNLLAAELEMRKALALDDTDSITHQRMGSIFGMQKNRLLLAEKELLRAVELDPKNYLAFENLGILYRLTGKTEKAIQALRRSLEIYPNQEGVEKALAKLEKNNR
jgi:spermidine synthase/tetratricopeptide (TPR) repeat protein